MILIPQLVDAILVALVLTGFLLLASSRLSSCIRATSIQGILLGLLAIAVQGGSFSMVGGLLALATASVKGILLPWLLLRAMREADTVREIEPLISYNISILLGVVSFGVALWLGQHLQIPGHAVPFLVPAAIFTILVGLIVIVSRRKAITQVIGYLTLENGVYAFGSAVAVQMPVLVELGILLDVLVGVFVMGIAIFHISRQFDHIDTDLLVSLTDNL